MVRKYCTSWRNYQYLQGFIIHLRWLFGISSINKITVVYEIKAFLIGSMGLTDLFPHLPYVCHRKESTCRKLCIDGCTIHGFYEFELSRFWEKTPILCRRAKEWFIWKHMIWYPQPTKRDENRVGRYTFAPVSWKWAPWKTSDSMLVLSTKKCKLQ